MTETRWQRMLRRFEWPMALLALLIIPVLVMEERATTPEMRGVAMATNWVIWIAFVVEFAVGWAADRTWHFPRKHGSTCC